MAKGIARDEFSIDFPSEDVDKLFDAMGQAQMLLGKSLPDSIAWAGALICRSLGGATRKSATIRPIVRNPDPRWKTDRRRAPFGVMTYKKGQQVFKPIFRGGEFGRRRFYDPRSMSWFEHYGPQKNTWRKVASGPDQANPEIIVPGIMNDKRRIIGRSGLAKKTWRAMGGRMRRSGWVKPSGMGMWNVAGRVQWDARKEGVRFVNELDYARDALNGNESQAVDKAANSMYKRISLKLDGTIKEKVG